MCKNCDFMFWKTLGLRSLRKNETAPAGPKLGFKNKSRGGIGLQNEIRLHLWRRPWCRQLKWASDHSWHSKRCTKSEHKWNRTRSIHDDMICNTDYKRITCILFLKLIKAFVLTIEYGVFLRDLLPPTRTWRFSTPKYSTNYKSTYILLACLHGVFHCGLIVAFGRLWLFICWVTLKKATFFNVTQKIKATIDQKPQFGHNEMRHVNRLYVYHDLYIYSGYICALMFCAFLLRDFNQYSIRDSMQCSLLVCEQSNSWHGGLPTYTTAIGRCFRSLLWTAQRSCSPLVEAAQHSCSPLPKSFNVTLFWGHILVYWTFFVVSGVFKGKRARHLPRPPLFGPPPLRCYARKFSEFFMKNFLFTHVMYYKADH